MFSWVRGNRGTNDDTNDVSQQASQSAESQSSNTRATRSLTAEELREQRARKLAQLSAASAAAAPPTEPAPQPRPATAAPKPTVSAPATVTQSAPSFAAAPQPATATSPSRAPIATTAITSLATPTSSSPPSKGTTLKSSASSPITQSSQPQSQSSLLSQYSALPHSLQPNIAQPLSPTAWLSELILEVLQICIDKPKPSHSIRYAVQRTFLAESAREAAESALSTGSSDREVTTGQLDSLLIERLSLPLTPLYSLAIQYLIASYKRCWDLLMTLNHLSSQSQSLSVFPSGTSDFERVIETCQTLLQCIISYCGMVLTDDESTTKEANQNELFKLIINSANSNSLARAVLPSNFIESLCKYSDGDTLRDAMLPIIDACGPMIGKGQQELATSPFELSKFKLSVLAMLARQSVLANLITGHPSFLPPPVTQAPMNPMFPWLPAQSVPHNGRTYQNQSLLGYHLSHTVAPTDPIFANIRSKHKADLDIETNRLRSEYGDYHSKIHELFKSLIRDKTSRERVCQYFTMISNLNSINIKRRSHGYDEPHSRSTDGLIFNCMLALLKLALPIVNKKNFDDLIKLEYTLNSDSKRFINYDNSTRIVATSGDITAKKSELSADSLASFNFSTECFFLLHEYLTLCSGIFKDYGKLNQIIGQTQRRLRGDSANREQLEAELDELFKQLCALNVHLFEPQWHAETISFFEFNSAWIASNSVKNHPLIGFVPESAVENVIDYYQWLGRFSYNTPLLTTLSSNQPSLQSLCDFILTFAHGPHALKNPHTRAKIPSMIQGLFIPYSNDSGSASIGPFHYVFKYENLRSDLVPALIDLYVQIEFGAGMFYQKFNARYELTLILEYLYRNEEFYQQKLIELSKDLNSFLLFTNALANDLVFLLDDALKFLSQIKDYQSSDNSAGTEAERREREQQHQQTEGQCQSLMQLASSTINFLSLLTNQIIEPFVTPQLDFCSRFATTLMYYINKLVGPSISELRVRDKEKYHFHPRELLKEILTIFIHLSSSKLFIEKVASDERSYSNDIMERALSIVNRRGILEERELRAFRRIKVELFTAHELLANWESVVMEDIPDNYLDSLLGSLMTDPVKLPVSSMIVDRVTIQRHLLNSKTDPFNRAPLEEKELMELPELKAEIAAYVEQKKIEYTASLAKKHADTENETEPASDGSGSRSASSGVSMEQ